MRRYVDALYEHVVLIDVDPALISRFQLGLVIGLVWITTLSFFPGKPLGISYGADPDIAAETENESKVEQDSTSTITKPTYVPQTRALEDELSPEQLEKIRVKCGLSKEQFKDAIRKSKSPENGSSLLQTPLYKVFNRLVYVMAFAALFYVLNRDYNNYASWWFARYFPNEARTMGMFVPEGNN